MDSNTKILIVEDSPSMRKVLRLMLKGLGYGEVSEAQDGAEALERMRYQSFDLLISDWNMPNMSGLELLESVRAQPDTADVAVIMSTSRNDKQDVMAAVKAGANNYISKPFKAEQLQAKIEQVMSRRAREQELRKIDEVLTNAANNAMQMDADGAAEGGDVPSFAIFVEQTIDPDQLKEIDNGDTARLLLCKVDAFTKVSGHIANVQMRYLLADDGQDVMHMVRSFQNYIKLILISDDVEGGGATLARLIARDQNRDYKVYLAVDTVFKLPVEERTVMRKLGVELLEKRRIKPDIIEDLFRQHFAVVAPSPAQG